MVAGSDRFWLCELRVSQHFSAFYGSSVQSMGIQLNALPALPVRARTVSGCLNSALLGLERNRPAVVTSQLLGEPASALLCSCFASESLAQTAPLSRATNLHKSKPCAALRLRSRACTRKAATACGEAIVCARPFGYRLLPFLYHTPVQYRSKVGLVHA